MYTMKARELMGVWDCQAREEFLFLSPVQFPLLQYWDLREHMTIIASYAAKLCCFHAFSLYVDTGQGAIPVNSTECVYPFKTGSTLKEL